MDQNDRLTPAIERQRDALRRRVRLDTGEPLAPDFDPVVFERTLDNTLAEVFAYQNLKSRALLRGKITVEEAQVIYQAIGEAPGSDGWAAGTDLATKVVVTSVLGALAASRV